MNVHTSYWLLAGLLLWAGFVGCEQDFSHQILPPYPGDRLVLNAWLNPHQPLEVQLLHSLPPLAPADTLPVVAHARIKLFEAGIFIDTLRYSDSGRYSLRPAFYVQPGKAYHFEVEAEGFPSVTSHPELVPLRYPILETHHLDSLFPCSGCPAPYNAAQIIWKAPQKHYLRVNYRGEFNGESQGLGSQSFMIPNPSEASICATGEIWQNLPCLKEDVFVLFSPLTDYLSVQGTPHYYEHISAQIQFISSSYYSFLVSQQQPGDLERIFLYPNNIFSNIDGGYGLVAGVNDTLVDFP